MNLLNHLLIISHSKGQIACSVPKVDGVAREIEVDFQIFEVAEWGRCLVAFTGRTWGMYESGGT